MSEWAQRNRSPVRAGLAAGLLACCAIVLVNWGCSGPATKQPGQSGADSLSAKLSGEWVKADSPSTTLYFTSSSNKLVYSFVERVKLPMQSRLDPPVYTGEERTVTKTYEYMITGGSSIKIGAASHEIHHVTIDFEFITDDEFMAICKAHEFGSAPKVEGRFRRKTPALAVAKTPGDKAKAQIEKFEQKRGRLQPLLETAFTDQRELVQKLKNAGVEKPADLKGNPQAQKLAELLRKVTVEIDGLERQIITLDAAILDAKAISRRLERERAGISDDEMEKLGIQLRELEERTDGTSGAPTTPLDIEAAFQKATKNRK